MWLLKSALSRVVWETHPVILLASLKEKINQRTRFIKLLQIGVTLAIADRGRSYQKSEQVILLQIGGGIIS